MRSPTTCNAFKLTKNGNGNFMKWPSSQLFNTKSQHNSLGITLGKLTSKKFIDPSTGGMGGFEYDYNGGTFQTIHQNFQLHPLSIHMASQAKITINNFFKSKNGPAARNVVHQDSTSRCAAMTAYPDNTEEHSHKPKDSTRSTNS
jgi:hypothetical protein